MQILIGFVIALAVGLTGIGGGSFTVPALLLLVGLPAGAAVGTAFVFATVLRLIAAPFYVLGKLVHSRYLWLLLLGAVPGLVIGTILLRRFGGEPSAPVVVIIIGAMIVVSSSLTFLGRLQNRDFARKNSRWLPWLALPLGVESGFSSAGAGALGTLLLMNYSEMSAAQVVGTDILFGLALSVLGSVFHWKFGVISVAVLLQLLVGGVPGVLLGCAASRKLPAARLRAAVTTIAMLAALQLVWSGAHTLLAHRAPAEPRVLPSTASLAVHIK
jgi:uncharacterized membrane protein YfcA